MNQQQPENHSQTRRDIEARMIAKAWKDEAYKQELLANPKAVFEQEFG
ncbi:MAG: NHLP leader peptide family natural product precursor, partial [Cyanobacteria bacterium P01_A01_bin.83]